MREVMVEPLIRFAAEVRRNPNGRKRYRGLAVERNGRTNWEVFRDYVYDLNTNWPGLLTEADRLFFDEMFTEFDRD